MKFNVCFNSATGEIRQVDNGAVPPDYDGYECLSDDADDTSSIFGIAPATHVVDLTTRTVRPKTESERAAALAPTDTDIAALVASELDDTDQYMMPDRVVANRDEWVTYRQSLRDLSKMQGTAADRLTAFPARPDGDVAVTLLRILRKHADT